MSENGQDFSATFQEILEHADPKLVKQAEEAINAYVRAKVRSTLPLPEPQKERECGAAAS